MQLHFLVIFAIPATPLRAVAGTWGSRRTVWAAVP